ncbi:DJ-1/PfpI family protein [Parasphingorhabdus pacifica]
MDIAFVLYDRMTALDVIGPYEVLANAPSVTAHFVAARRGAVRCDAGLPLHATAAFEELTNPDVIVVPGSSFWRDALADDELVDWLAKAHPAAAWTASVCSGSTLLAKAGILTGRGATTHWAVRGTLMGLGADVLDERVVVDGDVITGAGVTAGLDMALTLTSILWGDKVARTIQLAIEYAPQPPFDTGTPERAPAEIVTGVRNWVVGT